MEKLNENFNLYSKLMMNLDEVLDILQSPESKNLSKVQLDDLMNYFFFLKDCVLNLSDAAPTTGGGGHRKGT